MNPPTTTIHHLSDIHFGSSHFRPDNKSSFIPTMKSRNADEYLRYLGSLSSEASPDLVILSGDFTTIASEEEMNLAADFIHRIKRLTRLNPRTLLKSSSPRLFVVPGNHDLDWSKESPKERHERYARLSDTVFDGGQVVSSMYHIERDSKPWYDFGDEANLFVYVLNSTHYGGSKDPVLSAMYESIRSHADQIRVSQEHLDEFKRQVRKDPGFVLDDDIELLKTAAHACPMGRVKVAVVHHNPNHVPTYDLEAYDTILNAGRLKSALLEAGYDLVLHGHRHVFHCSVESQPIASFCHNRCLFVSADSFGSKERAPFVEIKLSHAVQFDKERDALPRLSLTEYEYNLSGGFGPNRVHCERLVHNQFEEDISSLSALDHHVDQGSRKRVSDHLNALLPNLQKLQSEIFDWSESSGWIRDVHDQFQSYSQLFATSLHDRYTDAGNPRFGQYLREQYDERMKRLATRADKAFYFSPETFNAIVRTRWRPSELFWPDYEVKKSDQFERIGFEIVRIMLVDKSSLDDIAIRNLEHDHAIHAIPLFLLEKRAIAVEHAIDFVIGMDRESRPATVWAYDEQEGRVKQQRDIRKWDLLDAFEKLLKHDRLATASQFLGDGPMYTVKPTIAEKIQSYSDNRRASPLILQVIEKHLPRNANRGLDLCCGTGNYTLPFEGKFAELVGLDQSIEMLEKARPRSDRINWRVADAKATKLPDNYYNAAWMISALHYFKGEEQRLLLEEVFRILAPGGIFIADTEFIEQHSSLWIVEYFPSLKQRYRDALFSQTQYRDMLARIGFSKTTFETHDYLAQEGDAFLRIGQHQPAVYLRSEIHNAIPAFQEMDRLKRRRGLARLQNEIATGEIRFVIERYKKQAKLPGDLGFIVSQK